MGRNLKLHLLTAVIGISAARVCDLIRKTLIFSNADFPHSSVQPLGFDGELLGTLIPGIVPRGIARQIGNRSYGFFLQTEDGAHRDNRVIAGQRGRGAGRCSTTTPPGRRHRSPSIGSWCGASGRISLPAGMLAFSQRIGIAGTAHVSGTLTAGKDPRRSVVDSEGAVHGMKSLYVVDGSVLPRSSRVNPSLTIYAWALRAADALARRLRRPAALREKRMIAAPSETTGPPAARAAVAGSAAVVLRLALWCLLSSPQGAMAASAAPAVRAIESISVPVEDMERSVAFYHGVLGFVQTADREVAGDAYEHLYGVFGARVRIVTLKLGDETLKLEQFIAPHGRPMPVDSRSNDRWFQHVAIIVSDMDRAFEWLRAQRVQFASTGPQLLPRMESERGRHLGVLFPRPRRPPTRSAAFPAGQGRPQVAGPRQPLVPRHRSFRDRRDRHRCEPGLLPRHAGS